MSNCKSWWRKKWFILNELCINQIRIKLESEWTTLCFVPLCIVAILVQIPDGFWILNTRSVSKRNTKCLLFNPTLIINNRFTLSLTKRVLDLYIFCVFLVFIKSVIDRNKVCTYPYRCHVRILGCIECTHNSLTPSTVGTKS